MHGALPSSPKWCDALAWAALPFTVLLLSRPHVCIF